MTGTRPDASPPPATTTPGPLARLRDRTTVLRDRATGALPRPRWTLRRRLVALVVALVAVVAVAIGGLTTLALRGSLVAQLDDDLKGAHNRFMMWSDDGPVGTGASTGGDVVVRRAPAEEPPVGLPGQEVGTVTFAVEPGQTADDVSAAYLLRSGEQRVVPTEAVEALLALPHDGQVRAVDLAGVGEYRALVTTTRGGDVAVTAVPTASVTRTLTSYVLMVGVVALLAVLAAAAAGLVLVRRELRPQIGRAHV